MKESPLEHDPCFANCVHHHVKASIWSTKNEEKGDKLHNKLPFDINSYSNKDKQNAEENGRKIIKGKDGEVI